MEINGRTYKRSYLKDIENKPMSYVSNISITELEQLLTDASYAYYNTDKELISDTTYDILIDYLKSIKPKSVVLKQIGAPPKKIDKKIKLPYHMGSMDKIKYGEQRLTNWSSKYPGPYTFADKLDGLSGLFVLKNNSLFLYKRGDGDMAIDISHLIKYINFGKLKVDNLKNEYIELVIRGEIVIKEDLFKKKYSDQYPKSRSLIAGIVNSKVSKFKDESRCNIARDLDFVAYQILALKKSSNISSENSMGVNNDYIKKYNEHLTCLEKIKINKVYHEIHNKVDLISDYMPEYYLERIDKSEYRIDGIIVTDLNDVYKNPKSGNPKSAVAFKMPLSDQEMETVITDIEYNISKNGVLKPRIKYEPIFISGDKLTYTTGFNAKYIKDNNLTIGVKIIIIRSGDVIPYIKHIYKSDKKWLEPSIPYKWSSSGVDAIALDLSDNNNDYLSKVFLHFFNTFKVDGLKIGIINKFIADGIVDLRSILLLTTDKLMIIDGFKERSATNIVTSIKENILDKEHELALVLTASNKFNGFAYKKLKLITDYMRDNNIHELKKLTLDNIISIDGFASKSAEQFLSSIDDYLEWYNNLNDLIKIKKTDTKTKKIKLNGISVVFSGKRDEKFKNYLLENGYTIKDTLTKNVSVLVVKDKSATSSKITKANKLDIKIYSFDEYMKKTGYN